MLDPYQQLGVSRTASQDEIKNAYRKLAKKFHPDRNPGNKQAEHRFKDINQAYEIVGTPENRAKFDKGEWGMDEAGAGPRAQPQYEFDEDFFSGLFGGRRRGRAGGFHMPGVDEVYQMEMSLRESILGGEREIRLPSGKRLHVRIPRGVAPGQKLRFQGQGGPGLGGGAPGDVYVELFLAPDERFTLEGSTLVHELAVPLETAVLGGELAVPTPEGQVQLRIPRHSNSGRRLRVNGKGIHAKGGARGDLLVKLLIVLPEVISAELENAVRSIREKKAS
ncbi:MAG TPA: DnaJ C-terminal domain-containing protein [Bdellovibrionota bacterium]|jgi:DnaJ-class molecular chaperone